MLLEDIKAQQLVERCDNCGYSCLLFRLRPIPEFTDTTDTDTLDLHQYRYRVPIVPIPVVMSQPPRRVVLRYYA